MKLTPTVMMTKGKDVVHVAKHQVDEFKAAGYSAAKVAVAPAEKTAETEKGDEKTAEKK